MLCAQRGAVSWVTDVSKSIRPTQCPHKAGTMISVQFAALGRGGEGPNMWACYNVRCIYVVPGAHSLSVGWQYTWREVGRYVEIIEPLNPQHPVCGGGENPGTSLSGSIILTPDQLIGAGYFANLGTWDLVPGGTGRNRSQDNSGYFWVLGK